MTLSSIFYNTFMYPLELFRLKGFRKQFIYKAKGNVLEIGAGTGVNSKYYNKKEINKLTITDIRDVSHLKDNIHLKNINTSFKVISIDDKPIPFKDNSFDTVVVTLVFCSVKDPKAGYEEIYRVLKNDGRLIFIEHVLPHKKHIKNIVNSVNEIWSRISNGCNLNRQTETTIKINGFNIVDIKKSKSGIFIAGVAKKER